MQAYRPRCEVGQMRRLAVRSATCLGANWTVPSRPGRFVSWQFSDRCPRGVKRHSKEVHLTCSNDGVLKQIDSFGIVDYADSTDYVGHDVNKHYDI